MIAVDTNILVYAHRADSSHHVAAREVVRDLAERPASWAIPWPCLHEFLAIATHGRIYDPPTSPAQALEQVADWLASPSLVTLGETASHFEMLQRLLEQSRVKGAAIHDARIAAICLCHGVRTLYSCDRDFTRFTALKTRNPLL